MIIRVLEMLSNEFSLLLFSFPLFWRKSLLRKRMNGFQFFGESRVYQSKINI